MAEQLDLTTPETFVDIDNYKVVKLDLDNDVPSIKVTLESNTGVRIIWSLAPPVGAIDGTAPGTSPAEIQAGLSFINQGKFMVNQSISLQRWLMEQMSAKGFKIGTVSGIPD